ICTDPLGLRCGMDGRPAIAAGYQIDTLVLGDSQAFGLGVDYEQSIVGVAAVLAAEEGRVVGNAAVGGHYLRNQVELARRLTSLLRAGLSAPKELDRILAETETEAGVRYSELQRKAIRTALTSPVAIVTGGPGTGKSSVVSRMLLGLSKVMVDFDSESVALCAPTGRAKARLAESIGQNLASLSALDPIAASLSNVPAATLHSLLGALPNGTFRHHPGNPLPHRVVVLDEASMVDLPLFAAFLSALSPSARVILVGDPDQLPSVDAGAVLADLVANPNLGASCVHLSHTHRNAGAIAEICRVVREGGDVASTLVASRGKSTDMQAVRAVVGEVAHLCDERIETLLPLWLEERFGESMRSGFQVGTGFVDPSALLALVERSRILCAVHDGRSGASALNAQADAWLRERFPSSWRGTFAPGQQVILTRNHALRDLWNGDLGVVVEHDARLVAVFSKPGKILTIPVEQLDGLESAWAVTVHKSQGSEFDEVLFALPERDSPVLTRQILYTALSRARRTVFVHGDAELAAKAVSRSADRPSAVREAVPG
ncbi:MAG: exodeoxyribonuclease V subunit alpha, partial [Fibrobacterota bacterium]